MQSEAETPSMRNKATGALFACGLALIVLGGVTFLFDWGQAGMVFSVGMVACMVSALLGEKTSPSEVITIAAGASFFAWLILRNL